MLSENQLPGGLRAQRYPLAQKKMTKTSFKVRKRLKRQKSSIYKLLVDTITAHLTGNVGQGSLVGVGGIQDDPVGVILCVRLFLSDSPSMRNLYPRGN